MSRRPPKPISLPRRWARQASHLAPRWIALAVLLALLPTMARTPQSGDGAEVIATAVRGGVLHPTGFPLQAWLDRLLALLPVSPALSLSFLGLAAHGGAAYFVAETLRILGVSVSGQALGAVAFAFFPPLWGLAVQPEVFALAHLLIAAAIHGAVWGAIRPDAVRPREAGALGLLAAACAAQHPIAVTAAPALLAAAGRVLRPRRRRFARLFLLILAFAAPAAALYLSLPLLRTSSIWPDWGALASAASVLHHALRVDYGSFSFSAAGGTEATRSGLAVWWRDLWSAWGPAFLLAAIGAASAARRAAWRPSLAPVAGAFFAGLAILWRARLPEQSYSDAYLSKLEGPVTLAAALWLGIGFQEVRNLLPGRAWRPVLAVASLLAAIFWLVTGWPGADARADRTLEIYQRGLALELPAEAVWATQSEVEAMMGLPAAGGRRGMTPARFPVSEPLGSLDWYARRVAPQLEPRLADVALDDWAAYVGAALARGFAVAASSSELIAAPGAVPQLRGLLYVARPGGTQELTPATVSSALRLSALAAELPVLPARGHEFSRFYARRFARAYAGAAEALRRAGQDRAAAAAESVARQIDTGRDATERARWLRELAAEVAGGR